MRLPFVKLIDLPPIWLLTFAVALWWLGEGLPWPTGSDVVHGVGTVLVGLGLLITLIAALQFRRHKTTIVPHLTASHLVKTGLYRLSRNPIYVADALILSGLALRWDILHGLALVPLFMWVIQVRFITGEEARLRASFPTEYAEYASKTRRWL